MSTRVHYFLLFALVLASCMAPTALPNTIALIHGTLIDGTGADPIPNAVLLIQGERILDVGSKEDVKIPRGARVIDLERNTILPGFINAHVHFAFNEQNLEKWAYGGVTTVRDESITSSRPLSELMKLRKATSQNPKYARLISAGYMMTVPGGYGNLLVSSPEEARQKVLDELDSGVEMIKISMEDGYAGRHGLPKLRDDQIAAIISAAHERGTQVSGHVTQAAYLTILVKAGVDDIAHVPYDVVANEVWQEMVSKSIYMTPTFTVYRNYNAPVTTCMLNLHNFVNQGGQVALGNDYGGGPGSFELGIPLYEIEQMSQAGMTPMQIIVASTKNAAHVSGIEEEVGTLEAGKNADVLIVSGNPLDDLQNLKNIRMVIHNGTIIRDESDS